MIQNYLLNDFFDNLWTEITTQRKNAIESFCSNTIQQIVEDSINEIEQHKTLVFRLASLSPTSQQNFMEVLNKKEKFKLLHIKNVL